MPKFVKFLTFTFIFSVIFFATPAKVFAQQPAFFSCLSPLQSPNVSYSDGVHGVPGDVSTHTGSDSVYNIENGAVQCLCEPSGQGTQTNWWKVNGMSQEQINVYTSQGWIYIPDGSAWGLDNAPYLAQNAFFICGPVGRGGGEILGTNTLGTGGGEVLGLASTGGKNTVFLTLLGGLLLINLGLYFYNEKHSV